MTFAGHEVTGLGNAAVVRFYFYFQKMLSFSWRQMKMKIFFPYPRP